MNNLEESKVLEIAALIRSIDPDQNAPRLTINWSWVERLDSTQGSVYYGEATLEELQKKVGKTCFLKLTGLFQHQCLEIY